MKTLFGGIFLVLLLCFNVYGIITSFTRVVEVNGNVADQSKYFLGIFDDITVSRLQLLNASKVYWNVDEWINLPITVTSDISIDTALYTLEEICNLYSVTEDFLKAYNPNAIYKTP